MGKKIKAILNAAQPLKLLQDHKSKTQSALVVNSPFDDANDSRVKFSAACGFVNALGYGVINHNTKQLTFDMKEEAIKSVTKIDKGYKVPDTITIWFNGHGTTGWLFGQNKNASSEHSGALTFAEFVLRVEKLTGKRVSNIVLGACYSASEMVSPDYDSFVNSPARILSLLLPDKEIVGFVGQFGDKTITHVYHDEGGIYKEISLSPNDAAILFQDGRVIEDRSETKPLHCCHKYTPAFIIENCGLPIKPVIARIGISPIAEQFVDRTHYKPTQSEDFYKPCAAREEMHEIYGRNYEDLPDCYGKEQIARAISDGASLADTYKSKAPHFSA